MKAILFDLDDTLFDHRDAMTALLRDEFGLSGAQIATLLEVDARGKTARDHFCGRVASIVGGDGQDVWQRLQREFGRYAELSDADALEKAAHEFRLGLLTNGGALNQRTKIAALGLDRWIDPDHIFISALIGAEKPSRRAFELALDGLDVSPDEAVFVGDDPVADIGGARRAGLRTCWVARGRTFPDTPGPDWTIDTIADLPTLWHEFQT